MSFSALNVYRRPQCLRNRPESGCCRTGRSVPVAEYTFSGGLYLVGMQLVCGNSLIGASAVYTVSQLQVNGSHWQ